MDTTVNFLMGFSTAVLPAIVFITWYLHRNGLEVTSVLEKRLNNAVVELNSAQQEAVSLKKRLANSEKNNIELTQQREDLQSQLDTFGMKTITDLLSSLEKNLHPSNDLISQQKFKDRVEFAKESGIRISDEKRKEMFSQLEESINIVNKKDELQQQRLKFQEIVEQAKSDEDYEREILNYQSEQSILESALQSSSKIKGYTDEKNSEVEWMKSQLEDVKAKLEEVRRKSYKKEPGYLYVISNIGSFGDDVYLVGFTGRLEPLDVVKKMSGESVPFSFDVQMVVFSDDAKGLERQLHEDLEEYKVNKEDPKKGFFRTEIKEISKVIAKFQGHEDAEEKAEVAADANSNAESGDNEETNHGIDDCTVARSNPFDKVA